MFKSIFRVLDFSVDKEIEFETIEEALKTCCPYCGTELEWTLTVKYNPEKEIPEIHGISHSCGVEFIIEPLTEHNIYIIKERLVKE